jgi:starvation-inducible outer membrane lipoprotein
MKILLALLTTLSLAGCASAPPPQFITKTELQVVVPERTMFYCQNVRKFPNPETLTDVEVAKLLVSLHSKNTECQKNMNALYKFLDEAKKRTEKKDGKEKSN